MSRRGRYRKFSENFEPEPWYSDNEENLNITDHDRDIVIPAVAGGNRDNDVDVDGPDDDNRVVPDGPVSEEVPAEPENLDSGSNSEESALNLTGDDDDEVPMHVDQNASEDPDDVELLSDGPEDVELLGDGPDDGELLGDGPDEAEGLGDGPEDVELLGNDPGELGDNPALLDALLQGVDNVEDEQVENNTEGEEDLNDFEVVDDYGTILKHISKEWLKIELTHRVSKTASNLLWQLGKEWFHRLFTVKAFQKVKRKTPSFAHIRQQMYRQFVPPIRMEIGYKHRENGVTTVLENTLSTPKSDYPSHEYDKMWEIAHVEVTKVFLHFDEVRVFFCFLHVCKQYAKRKN